VRTVVLVPWRPGEPVRERNREIASRWLDELGWPITDGDRPGPWSRAAAVNAAARRAGRWDLALVADADTIGEPAVVAEAAALALRIGGGVRPHDRLWRLRRHATARVSRHGTRGLGGSRLSSGLQPGGGLLVIARKAWEAVGGFDERFTGWGHEDSFLGYSLVERAAWARVPGEAWHLWHPPAVRREPEYGRNRAMMIQKRAEAAVALERASRRLGFDVAAVL